MIGVLLRPSMASVPPSRRADSDGVQLETGDLIDDFERRAQELSGSNGIYSNLTEFGATLHGIEQSTPVTVLVFEEGIWITKDNE